MCIYVKWLLIIDLIIGSKLILVWHNDTTFEYDFGVPVHDWRCVHKTSENQFRTHTRNSSNQNTVYTRYNNLIGRILSTNMKLTLKRFMTITDPRNLHSA